MQIKGKLGKEKEKINLLVLKNPILIMAKRKRSTRKLKTRNNITIKLLPLFVITVCIVFSFLFTVMMTPLGNITADMKFLFLMLLVVSATVASTVSIIFYTFFLKS